MATRDKRAAMAQRANYAATVWLAAGFDPEVADNLTVAAAELRKGGWQPIETAPKDDAVAFFWIVPKAVDETYLDTSGRPITSAHTPYRHYGRYGSWGSLSKAILWHPAPDPPNSEEGQ